MESRGAIDAGPATAPAVEGARRWCVLTGVIALAATGIGDRWGVPDPAWGTVARWSITAIENPVRTVCGISMVLWAVFSPSAAPPENEP